MDLTPMPDIGAIRPVIEGGLADALRARTQPLHVVAERAGILRDLLRGDADLDAYLLFLRNLLPAYEALETGLEAHRASPALSAFARPEIYRSAAIRADLAILSGRGWSSAIPLLPSAQRYAARIAQITAGPMALLIAHCYVRYLGDLNGGQIIKRSLGRAFGLGPASLSFYEFPDIADRPSFLKRYRSRFDEAGSRIGAFEPLLSEAEDAFRFNIALSEDVRSARA